MNGQDNSGNQVLDTLGRGYGLDWGQLVMRQFDRIMSSCCKDLINKTNEDTFRNSIRGLDALMKPYHSQRYTQEKERIKGEDKIMNELDEFYEWLSALAELAAECGLVPFEEETLYDKEE